MSKSYAQARSSHSTDERTITVSTGAFILVPPDIAHSFFNPTAAPASYLAWFSPGGHEHYFQEVALLSGAEPGWPPTDETILDALNQKYDQYVMSTV